jgi:hypothetical protein
MQKRPFCIHTHQNRRYFSPETEVMELKLEGVIATSITTTDLLGGTGSIPGPEDLNGVGF